LSGRSNADTLLGMRVVVWPLVAFALVLTVVGCGGKTVTRTVTVGGTGPGTTSADTSTPSEDQVKVEQATLVYLPEQQGGNFHTLLVLLRNDSDATAVDVGGQVSILDPEGGLVHSVEPTPVTILPHGEGLFVEDVDLPKPVRRAKLTTHLAVTRFASGGSSPVSFSRLRNRPANFGRCTITGVVSNQFTERKQNLQLRVAGFTGPKLTTGGVTYVDTVFPRTDATFDVDMLSPALCPRRLDRIQVLPNLSEDKIFNP